MDSPGTNAARDQRSNSTSSAGSQPASSPRRFSAGAGLFSSLQEQKRSADPTSMARRQSMHDQRPAPGLFGKMWNSWVHGQSSPPK